MSKLFLLAKLEEGKVIFDEDEVRIDKVVRELKKAKRPLICTGGGAHLSGAADVIRAFAEKHRIPVVSTMMGLGTMPTEHPMFFGMVGNNGQAYGNRAMNQADMILMAGARVAERSMASQGKPFSSLMGNRALRPSRECQKKPRFTETAK